MSTLQEVALRRVIVENAWKNAVAICPLSTASGRRSDNSVDRDFHLRSEGWCSDRHRYRTGTPSVIYKRKRTSNNNP